MEYNQQSQSQILIMVNLMSKMSKIFGQVNDTYINALLTSQKTHQKSSQVQSRSKKEVINTEMQIEVPRNGEDENIQVVNPGIQIQTEQKMMVEQQRYEVARSPYFNQYHREQLERAFPEMNDEDIHSLCNHIWQNTSQDEKIYYSLCLQNSTNKYKKKKHGGNLSHKVPPSSQNYPLKHPSNSPKIRVKAKNLKQ